MRMRNELPARVDVAVVGLGLMGAAAAFALARRGRAVLALDARPAGHTAGSSHGGSRIVRRAYAQDHYVAMTGAAWDGWLELEELSGRRLLTVTGGVDHGAPGGTHELRDALRRRGVACSLMDAAEATERWPHMRFQGPVLFHPQAGAVDPDAGIEVMTSLAAAAGADVRRDEPVRGMRLHDDRVEIATGEGTVAAGRAVVAAGPWTAELLDGAVPLPRLTVTQQQVFFFRRKQGDDASWPTAIHRGERMMYAVPEARGGGALPAMKIGDHSAGAVTTASTRDGRVDPEARQSAVRYVREWWPGLEAEPLDEASCLYTRTASEDFFLGSYGPLLVLSPCSGHGAKFAPLIGRWAAVLLEGGRLPYPFFDRAAHGAG